MTGFDETTYVAQGPDPYFDQNQSTGSRSRHYLEPPSVPFVKPDYQFPNTTPTLPQPETVAQPRWQPPANTPDWNSPQPYGNTREPSLLEQNLGNKSNSLISARDVQTGSSAAKAIIAGTSSGLLTQPIVKLTGANKWLAGETVISIDPAGKTLTAATSAPEAKWLTPKGIWQNASTAFWNTLGTGVVLSADRYARDHWYGENSRSWETTSLTVPLAMALPTSRFGKAFATGAALLGGHAIDTAIGAPSWMPESLKNFTAFDGLALGPAFVIPTKTNIAKAGVIGVAWLAGNVSESLFMPASAGEIENQALAATAADRSTRTKDSLDRAVRKFRELGEKNEVILEQNLAQVILDMNNKYGTMTQVEKLDMHRNMIVVAKALGEYRLEHGTRLSAAATDRPTYILPNSKLDLGADALNFLLMARKSVRESQNLGASQNEQADLEAVGKDIDRSIQAILGKHDLPAAMSDLNNFITRGTTASGATFNKELAIYKTFTEGINQTLGRSMKELRNSDGTLNQDAARVCAKLLRDQALIQIAMATNKLEHSDAQAASDLIFGTPQGAKERLPGTQVEKGFDGALQALYLADRLDMNNPDMPELQAMANALAKRIRPNGT